jgi:acyl carrier protein
MSLIEQDLRKFVVDNFLFGNDDFKFSDDDSFLEKGLIDSMGILNLISHVETRYGVQVADSDLLPEHWDSVNRIAAYVAARQAREVIKVEATCVS